MGPYKIQSTMPSADARVEGCASIKALRQEKNLRIDDLAEAAGVSRTELSKCERGLQLPDMDFFEAVAEVLSADPEGLRAYQSDLVEASLTPGEGYTTNQPDGTFVVKPRVQPSPGSITVMDLFCGVGGFSHGFEKTGEFEVVSGIDLLPDRINTFASNHPKATAFCKDIKNLSISKILDESVAPDVVIGGPPCQGFSSIRPFRNLTEDDPRNNLFEHFAIVVDQIEPEWFVLENVVGLLTHKNGQTLNTIVDIFEEAGYSVSWRVLNAAYYGLPQFRERLIMVGNRSGRSFEWPEPTHFCDGRRSMAGEHSQDVTQADLFTGKLERSLTIMEAIHDLPPLEAGEEATEYRDDVDPTDYEKQLRSEDKKLTLHKATNHSERMIKIIKASGSSRADLPDGMTSSGFSSSYSRLEEDLPSVTLTVNFIHPSSNKCIHPKQDRALTPREGARLQSFEDSYQFEGNRSQIVKQIGNAVPPLLGEVIAKGMINSM
jgi:DNA (cytosine-5)-methyltransferase 1